VCRVVGFGDRLGQEVYRAMPSVIVVRARRALGVELVGERGEEMMDMAVD
jgi:hypothetical protein